jgi:hypothetical protein
MGDQFTAADVVTGSGLRWGMGFGMIPKRPALVGVCRAPAGAAGVKAGDGEG